MTLLSYKLNHKNIEKILTVDGKQMYEEAKAANVPFYKWNQWIDEQLGRIYLNYIYRKKQRNSKKGSNSGSGSSDNSSISNEVSL